MIQKRHSSNHLGSFENPEKRSRSPARMTMKADSRQYSLERKIKLMKKKPIKEKDSKTSNDRQVKTTIVTTTNLNNNDNCFVNGRLFDAVLDGNASTVRQCLLTEDIEVNDYCPEGTTALHLASAAGFIDVLELLIEFGGLVDCTDVVGKTPLEYAALYGNFDCATLLIENGADSKCIKNGLH